MLQTVETTIADKKISIETGRIAKQAGGSVVARIGDTMVLATACGGKERLDGDFFPLSVDYMAKTYAAGKIPGGFFRREGKPTEKEILTSRLIDRPLRPLFPDGYHNEVQVIVTLLSADELYDADVLGITAASCALCLSDLPFAEPIAGIRIGMVDGKLIPFPTLEETENGMLDLVVAGTESSIMMVEGGAYEIKEDVLLEAIILAHTEIKKLIKIQKDLMVAVGKKQSAPFVAPQSDPAIYAAVEALVKDRIHDISFNGNKKVRYSGIDALRNEVQEKLKEQLPEKTKEIGNAFDLIEQKDIRETILSKGQRVGGRGLDDIRNITIELDLLPRVHGSALFTRGETQALVISTLGTKLDEQRVDDVQAEYSKSYMLHYNFPPFSVGEVKRTGSVGRREIGHGHLAERSISAVLPNEKSFPYTIRVVSEITESNGSSSMASVCGASLSLMAAGIPLKAHVAGVAMGLIKEQERVAILTDILGTEDHLGDMDFKVAGTRDGVTAIQMDIKIAGITPDIMRDALAKAFKARSSILDTMEAAISKPRAELSAYAPRITTMNINKDKIREVIGSGGKVIREIQELTQTTINIQDDGTIQIASQTRETRDAAIARIKAIVAEPELGALYDAKVVSVVDFGAFVEYLPGREGLVHISEFSDQRLPSMEGVCAVGDILRVKLTGFDRNGKVRLSKKAVTQE